MTTAIPIAFERNLGDYFQRPAKSEFTCACMVAEEEGKGPIIKEIRKDFRSEASPLGRIHFSFLIPIFLIILIYRAKLDKSEVACG